MGHTGPSLVVEPRMAAPPKFGLVASLPRSDKGLDPHWTNGIRYLPEGCMEGETFDPCSIHEVGSSSPPGIVEWLPYKLTAEDNCSTFGETFEERSARAQRLLQMDTERQLGFEFWTGTIAAESTFDGPDGVDQPWPNTWLANDADEFVDLSGATGVDVVSAFSCLNQYLAENNGGQQGAVFLTPQVLIQLQAFSLLRRENGQLLTDLDNIVIASPGFPGTGPDGTFSVGIWMYATDVPRLYLTEPRTQDRFGAIDRPNNVIAPVAERAGLVEWERCRHAGIAVDLEPCSGLGS